jgi:hypothetical protein
MTMTITTKPNSQQLQSAKCEPIKGGCNNGYTPR